MYTTKRYYQLGINYCKIPAYSQSLNTAEHVCDLAWAAGCAYLADTGALDKHMALALDYVCYEAPHGHYSLSAVAHTLPDHQGIHAFDRPLYSILHTGSRHRT